MPVMVRNTRASGATKREATYFEGLPTPNESMSTDGTLTPPKEELDEKDLISNIAKAPSFRSNDGLPKESAALEAIQAAARKARSPSRKFHLLLSHLSPTPFLSTLTNKLL